MVIEINKDIDRYQESVAMGLTAKQLVFSIASVIVGGGIGLLLYRYIGTSRTQAITTRISYRAIAQCCVLALPKP